MTSHQPAIRFESVSKLYRIGAQASLRSSLTQLPQRLLRRQQRDAAQDFWALREVTFDVHPGETLGIIGPNGAGKTTSLKLIARVTTPTAGKVQSRGRVSSLIELGAGFHPELTGRENVHLNGAILGMRRRELDRIFDRIVGFAELEQFIDTPVKRYSSGMYARLGFAVAAHINPDILLVDEVLSVGDAAFQKRCYEKMWDLVHHEGRSVVMVSHGFGYIRALCNRVLWLAHGQAQQMGTPDEVIRAYESHVFSRPNPLTTVTHSNQEDGQVQIVSVTLLDKRGCPKETYSPEDEVTIRIGYLHSRELPGLAFAVGVMRDDTLNCYTTFSDEAGFEVTDGGGGGIIEATYRQLRLMPGAYQMYVTALTNDNKRTVYTYRTVAFQVQSEENFDIRHGSFYNMPVWRIGRPDPTEGE